MNGRKPAKRIWSCEKGENQNMPLGGTHQLWVLPAYEKEKHIPVIGYTSSLQRSVWVLLGCELQGEFFFHLALLF